MTTQNLNCIRKCKIFTIWNPMLWEYHELSHMQCILDVKCERLYCFPKQLAYQCMLCNHLLPNTGKDDYHSNPVPKNYFYFFILFEVQISSFSLETAVEKTISPQGSFSRCSWGFSHITWSSSSSCHGIVLNWMFKFPFLFKTPPPAVEDDVIWPRPSFLTSTLYFECDWCFTTGVLH